MDKKSIIFISCLTDNNNQSRTINEILSIEPLLFDGKTSNEFDFIPRLGVTKNLLKKTILGNIKSNTPYILHFSMDCDEKNGLICVDQLQRLAYIKEQDLRPIFTEMQNNKRVIQCVFLNASNSLSLAKSIEQYVDFVICIGGTVPNQATIEFSKEFYESVFFNNNVRFDKCFLLGQMAVERWINDNNIQVDDEGEPFHERFKLLSHSLKTNKDPNSNTRISEESNDNDITPIEIPHKELPIINMPQPTMQEAKEVILFVSANPQGKNDTNSSAESQTISDTIDHSNGKLKDKYQMIPHFRTDINTFMDKLKQYKPTIVHLSMHGGDKKGVMFEDAAGTANYITAERLSDFFKIINKKSKTVECILISACNSDGHAKEVVQYVDAAIGMQGVVGVDVALEYTKGFYSSILQGDDYEMAHDTAVVLLKQYASDKDYTGKVKIPDIPQFFETNNKKA